MPNELTAEVLEVTTRLMTSRFRRFYVSAGLILLLGAVPQACKKKSDGSDTDLGPATLEFIGADNLVGDEFEPGDALSVGCEGYLAFHLGPEGDEPGTIENWTFRPRDLCGDRDQCGFVTLEVLDEEGEVLLRSEHPVASPVIELSDIALDDVAAVVATLTWGETGEPYLEDGVVVSATWEATVSSVCAENLGGAGGLSGGSGGRTSGDGGSPGTGGQATGGMMNLGGFGGLGGTGN